MNKKNTKSVVDRTVGEREFRMNSGQQFRFSHSHLNPNEVMRQIKALDKNKARVTLYIGLLLERSRAE